MNYRAGVVTGVLGTLLVVSVAGGAWWFVNSKKSESKSDKPAPAASVAKLLKEEDLNTVTLSPEAEQRLGVVVAELKRESMPRHRAYGGEVTVPPGRTVLVAAPLGGVLKAPESGLPEVGRRVTKGQPVILLSPLLTPEARTTLATAKVDADGQVKNAQTAASAAKIALERAEQLVRNEAGSRRNLDEAQAQHDLALKTLEAAQARSSLLDRMLGEVERGTASPITLEAPTDGVLRAVSALPGQSVPSGAALFEVVSLDRVWVRTAVLVSDLAELAAWADAAIAPLSGASHSTRPARPVSAPPSANPFSSTVDLYYSLDNQNVALIPGQRVRVLVPLARFINAGPYLLPWLSTAALTVPWSAVVHDIHGGTWVYERIKEQTYVRRRVEVRFVVKSRAALAAGPQAGTTIVAEGAQELFGVETGFSK